MFSSVISDDLPTSRDWYVSLFGFNVVFDSEWFVHLQAPDNDLLEVGILARSADVVPERVAGPPMGSMLTVVVDDVDALHDSVLHGTSSRSDVTVLEPPRNLFYGQRRMLLVDPNGLIVDVSSDCPPDPAWLASLT